MTQEWRHNFWRSSTLDFLILQTLAINLKLNNLEMLKCTQNYQINFRKRCKSLVAFAFILKELLLRGFFLAFRQNCAKLLIKYFRLHTKWF